jgi:hypothetical protein
MRLCCLALLGTVSGVACGQEHPMPLADWREPELVLQVARLAGGDRAVAVEITPRNQDHCPVLADGAHAEIAGKRLAILSRGGTFSVPDGPQLCEPARFQGQLPTDAAAAVPVTVADDSMTMRAIVSGLLSDRRLARGDDPGVPLRPGQTVSVQVGEATDVVKTGALSFIPAISEGSVPAFTLVVGEGTATVSGATVTFTMPAGVTAGPGNLRFTGAVIAAVTACTGLARCQAALGVDARTSAIVQP